MVRLLRFAAIVGMLLALTDYIWTIVDCWPLRHYASGSDLAKKIHLLIQRLCSPSYWFGMGAILYVLSELVFLKRSRARRSLSVGSTHPTGPGARHPVAR